MLLKFKKQIKSNKSLARLIFQPKRIIRQKKKKEKTAKEKKEKEVSKKKKIKQLPDPTTLFQAEFWCSSLTCTTNEREF